MKPLAPLLVLIATVISCVTLFFSLAGTARAVTLVTPQGQPVGGRWQRWADESKIPTVAGDLIFVPNASGCTAGITACSSSRSQGYPATETFVSLDVGTGPSARDSLYWELGHQFDWRYLTGAQRRYFARAWSTPHARWMDTTTALAAGYEDGLEAEFAQIYDDCAWGVNDEGESLSFPAPLGVTVPSVQIKDDTCRDITYTAAADGADLKTVSEPVR